MSTFNEEQDLTLHKFEKVAKQQEEEIKNRQTTEMDELHKEFDEKFDLCFLKFSKEVLDLKLTEEKLVNQQR